MPKEDPTTEAHPNPELNISKTKAKKNKKKKKHSNRSESSVSSGSVSEAAFVPPVPETSPLLEPPDPASSDVREEFYDAHESYHALPEPVIAIPAATTPSAPGVLVLNPSAEHEQKLKVAPPSPATDQESAGIATKEPSAITKPVTRPG